MRKRVLFIKAHINDYTRKDGTVVKAHEDKRTAATGRVEADNHAEAAVASAGRVSDKSPHREHTLASSQAALAATRGTKTPRDHMKAALAHDEAAQNHRSADHFSRNDMGLAGARQDHRAAAQSHAWAAASHREKAAKAAPKTNTLQRIMELQKKGKLTAAEKAEQESLETEWSNRWNEDYPTKKT